MPPLEKMKGLTMKSIDLNNLNKLSKLEQPISKLTPAYVTGEEEAEEQFSFIRQGTATNDLTKVVTTNKNRVTIDAITGKAFIEQNETKIEIANIAQTIGARPSVFQLLDILTKQFTAQGANSSRVEIPLSTFMEYRGIKDKKSARKQVNEDLDTLFNTSISFKKNDKNYIDIRLIDEKGIRNGIIRINFSSSFFAYLKSSNVMAYPLELCRIENWRYPHSYAIGRKIAEHKNMNVGKTNEDIISIKTILNSAQGIPTYEEVMASDGAVNRRIIETTEKALDGLEDILTWEYCKEKGTPLTDEELTNLTYDVFITLNIKVSWKKYPDQTKRLERKQERIDENIEKSKKKTRNRKKKKGTD